MSKSINKHFYGFIPDLQDNRDRIYEPSAIALPPLVDHRPGCPAVYDQGQLGSCTANALAAAFDFDRGKQGKQFLTPSRLFIYWNERSLEGTVNSDAGAAIRDGVKVLKTVGVPPETDWPYVISKFTDRPPVKSFQDALPNESLTYKRVTSSLSVMQNALASGLPFVAGITVYESFESDSAASTGVIPMPAKGEQLLGGHAILVVGYDNSKQHFICRNSWGTSWGLKGYFYLPYAYLTGALASDMWVIETVKAL